MLARLVDGCQVWLIRSMSNEYPISALKTLCDRNDAFCFQMAPVRRLYASVFTFDQAGKETFSGKRCS